MTRKGCIYTEQNNPGFRHGRGGSELHVYGTPSKRLRWVAEITYHGHRYRFRSTNYNNVRRWLDDMVNKFKGTSKE